MESLLQMSEETIRTNIIHFQNVQQQLREQIAQAEVEELKWTRALALKQGFWEYTPN